MHLEYLFVDSDQEQNNINVVYVLLIYFYGH